MKLLHLLLPLWAAAQTSYCAQDQPCTSNAACADTINGIQGICCSGKCIPGQPQRNVGEFCNSTSTDTCQPTCAPRTQSGTQALRCGPSNVCITVVGIHCNCTLNADCSTTNCTNGQCIATSNSLDNGDACLTSDECISGNCTGGTCVGRAQGATCSRTPQCAKDLSCFQSPGSFFSTCKPLCATGASNCCTVTANCASSGTVCFNNNCTANPTLGQFCIANQLPCDSATNICAPTCNMTGCYGPASCQNQNTLAVNVSCSTTFQATEQCVVGAFCNRSTSQCQSQVTAGKVCTNTYECASPLVCAPNCSASGCSATTVCQSPNSIADGQPCATASPQCGLTSSCAAVSGQAVCIELGSISAGASCSTNLLSFLYSPLCAGYNSSQQGYAYCTTNPNTTAGGYVCVPPGSLANGAQCDSSAQCKSNICAQNATSRNSYCIAANSIADGFACPNQDDACVSGICAEVSSSNRTTVCKTAAVVAANGACVDSRECADYAAKYARCTNNVCVVYLNKTCTLQSNGPQNQCGAGTTLYCACSGTCTAPQTVNSPTPSAFTKCNSALQDWNAVRPRGFQFPRDIDTVSGSNLTKLLKYECCLNCPSNALAIDYDYILDCKALTATSYVASCNAAEAPKLFQNCDGTATSEGLVQARLSMGVVGILLGILLGCSW